MAKNQQSPTEMAPSPPTQVPLLTGSVPLAPSLLSLRPPATMMAMMPAFFSSWKHWWGGGGGELTRSRPGIPDTGILLLTLSQCNSVPFVIDTALWGRRGRLCWLHCDNIRNKSPVSTVTKNLMMESYVEVGVPTLLFLSLSPRSLFRLPPQAPSPPVASCV